MGGYFSRVSVAQTKMNSSLDLIKQVIYNISMDMFVALADPTRRTILETLASSGELSATDIYEKFPVSPQNENTEPNKNYSRTGKNKKS
jgi:hypothetical protein